MIALAFPKYQSMHTKGSPIYGEHNPIIIICTTEILWIRAYLYNPRSQERAYSSTSLQAYLAHLGANGLHMNKWDIIMLVFKHKSHFYSFHMITSIHFAWKFIGTIRVHDLTSKTQKTQFQHGYTYPCT